MKPGELVTVAESDEFNIAITMDNGDAQVILTTP
jgi:hypothetical protein